MPKLNTKSIASASPGRHGDGEGLYLYVKDSGRKTWVLRLQWQGKRHDIGLGTVNEASKRPNDPLDELPILERRHLRLAEAREKAGILRAFAKSGRNPLVERDKEREHVPTFTDAMKKTHAALSPGWETKSAVAFLSSLETHACPTLGNIRIDLITSKDIQEALRPIWTAKPEQARKVRNRINQVLNYAHGQGWRTSEAPTKSVTTGLPKQPKGGNFEAMPFADVPAFAASLVGSAQTTGREALLHLILTGARNGEVRKARWGQIDLDKAEWNCPPDIMKAREAHTVTLCRQSVEMLKRLKASRPRTGSNDLVFPGRNGTVMSDMTIQRILRRAGHSYDPHGFRSSFRDWAAEKMPEIPDPVAEAAIAHIVPDKVIRAYKRTKFVEMRRKLLDGWGDFVMSKVPS